MARASRPMMRPNTRKPMIPIARYSSGKRVRKLPLRVDTDLIFRLIACPMGRLPPQKDVTERGEEDEQQTDQDAERPPGRYVARPVHAEIDAGEPDRRGQGDSEDGEPRERPGEDGGGRRRVRRVRRRERFPRSAPH